MNGIIVIDKPQGFTSFDVVAKLRGILREKRIGHGGTLDPMATGVLPVFIGEATKAADLDPDTEKVYAASVALGMKTDTGDVTGAVAAEGGSRPSERELREAIKGFVGELDQTPPMYSAIKVNGKKLYELAREGKTVERKPRRVTVYGIELTACDASGFSFVARCSKGTYIRTLAEDICESVGAYGALSALRRLKSGSFTEAQARTLGEVQRAADEGGLNELITPVERMFDGYKKLALSGEELRRFINGVKLGAPTNAAENEVFSVFGDSFCGLAKNVGGRLVKTLHYSEERA